MQNKTTGTSIHVLISTAEQLVGGCPHLLDEPYLHIDVYFPPLDRNMPSCSSDNARIPGSQQPTLEDMKYIVWGQRL